MTAERARGLLDLGIEATTRWPAPTLFGGFVGVAWVTDHLYPAGASPDDPNESADDALEHLLSQPAPWTLHFDLISGLVGFGIYLLDRPNTERQRRLLALVVDRLEELSTTTAAGRSWLTHPRHLPSAQRQLMPQGHYNLGLAHGVPGVIALLARLVDAGVDPDRCSALLTEAVDWLTSRRRESQQAMFTYWEAPGVPFRPTRVAWCYGDLGIACALLGAARVLHRTDAHELAIELACRSAQRERAGSGVVDAGLCHGAAGVAHMFTRLYNTTRRDEFRRAAEYWLAETLSMRLVDGPTAGFLMRQTQPEDSWTPAAGFLTGSAGIALAIMAAMTPISPEWDRCLLLSW